MEMGPSFSILGTSPDLRTGVREQTLNNLGEMHALRDRSKKNHDDIMGKHEINLKL